MRILTAKKLLSFVTLVILTVTSTSGLSLYAQNPESAKEGVGISPTKLTLNADPGKTLTGKFTVVNPGTTAVNYRVYVKDFHVRNEDYEKDFEPAPGATSPINWFRVPTDVKKLAPGDQVELNYTIAVPKDAVPRGYYAVIFAETMPVKTDGTGVNRLKRVGSLVYLTVDGGSVEKGQIESFSVAGWQQERPVKATLRIKNDGNVHFTPTGTIRLRDIFGRTISKTDINGTILPATIRKFNAELKLSQPFGIYKVDGNVKFLGKATQLGPKWIVVGSPFWLVLWTAIIVGWLVVLIRWIKRRAKRKKK